MNSEKFRNVSASIQSLVLAVAVVIGGGWSLYTFNRLHEIEQRELEIEAKERSLRERAILNIHLNCKQLPNDKSDRRYLAVTIDFENKGNRTEMLLWENSSIQATRVTVNDKGQLVNGKLYKAQFLHVDRKLIPISEAILPKHSKGYPFLFSFDKPGIYHIEFMTRLSKQAAEERSAEEKLVVSVEPSDYFVWHESTYVHVK